MERFARFLNYFKIFSSKKIRNFRFEGESSSTNLRNRETFEIENLSRKFEKKSTNATIQNAKLQIEKMFFDSPLESSTETNNLREWKRMVNGNCEDGHLSSASLSIEVENLGGWKFERLEA